MNIPATELKHLLKKLSGVKTEFFQIEPGLIRAQDSDVWVEVVAPVFSGQTPFTVQARKFIQVVNRFTGNITIERQEFKVVLKSAKAKVEIEAQPCKPGKRPDPPFGFHILPLTSTKELLNTAANTVSKLKSQEYGDVVQFKSTQIGLDDASPYVLQAVGFDSTVMTRVQREVGLNVPFNTLVNLLAVQIVQLMDGESVQFGETETGLHFVGNGITVIAAKPAKKYPDWEKYIPEQHTHQFSFSTNDLSAALRIVEPLEEGDGSIGLHFSDSVLQLSSVGASDEIEYQQVIPDVFDPVEFETRVNYKHLVGVTARANDLLVLSATGPEGILRFDSGEVTTLAASAYRGKK